MAHSLYFTYHTVLNLNESTPQFNSFSILKWNPTLLARN
uniref:Uncharacterized protein n=1 Tax=Anguilla anguilla TaxID=7936 RepID=A0A0E9PSP7_ANGAN